jgi:AraC-like DNA-binding protein
VTVVQVPTVATSVVFRTTVDGRSDLIVVGPRTRGRYHAPKDLPVCVRVALPAGAARRLFRTPVSELVDRAVPLVELWGAPAVELTASLEAARPAVATRPVDPTEVAPCPPVAAFPSLDELRPVAAALVAAFTTEPEPGLLRTAMHELAEPSARLNTVAERVGVGERYLRSLFAREIGLSPKQFARVSRVRTVLAMAGQHRWAAVAEEAGFFDQAHMIGDFRAVMGVPPAAFLAGKRPAATPCGSLSLDFE